MKLISTLALAVVLALSGSAFAKNTKPAKQAKNPHEMIVAKAATVGQLHGRQAHTPVAPADVTLATR